MAQANSFCVSSNATQAAAVRTTDQLSQLANEQKEDEFCQKIFNLLSKADSTFDTREKHAFVEKNGHLHKLIKNAVGEVCEALCIPRKLVFLVLNSMHDQMGHPGKNRMRETLRVHFYWPGYSNDIRDYVRSCYICQVKKFKPSRPAKIFAVGQELREEFKCNKPFDFVAMDLGNFAKPSRGYTYFVIAVCLVTRFMELAPLSSATSSALVNFVRKSVLRHNTPLVILTDRGRNLCAPPMEKLCSAFDIQHRKTTAHHPNANGGAEAVIKIVKKMCSYYYGGKESNWSSCLDEIAIHYNRTYHTAIRCSPIKALYGYEPNPILKSRLTKNEEMSTFVDEQIKLLASSVDQLILNLNSNHPAIDIREHTEAHSKKAADNMIRKENETRREVTLKVGDYVMVRNFQPNKYKHLSHACDGPFKIINVMRDKPNTFEIDLPEGDKRHRWISGEHLMLSPQRPSHLQPSNAPDIVSDDTMLRMPSPRPATNDDDQPMQHTRPKRIIRPPNKLNLMFRHDLSNSPVLSKTEDITSESSPLPSLERGDLVSRKPVPVFKAKTE